MCRSPFFAPLSQLARNFALASIIEQRFPKAYKRRLAEAVEDGEVAPQSGLLQLPVAFIASSTPMSAEGALDDGPEHVFPPCLAVDLQLFEPRYLAMIDRVMASMACKFAVQPSKTSRLGAILRLETANRLADGRVRVKAYVESRYRVVTRGEAVRRADDAAESYAADESVDELAVCDVEGMGGLCTVTCEPMLDDDDAPVAGVASGAGAACHLRGQSTSATHGRLARCATRLVAQSGPRAALAINGHFGQPPALPGALSFYLTALLDLSPAQRRACMETRSLAERQQVLIGFLRSLLPDHAAGGAASSEPASDGSASSAGPGGDGLRRRAVAAHEDAEAVQREVGVARIGEEGDDDEELDRVPADKALWLLTRTALRGDSVIAWGASQAQGPAGVVLMLLLLVFLLLVWNPSQLGHMDRALVR